MTGRNEATPLGEEVRALIAQARTEAADEERERAANELLGTLLMSSLSSGQAMDRLAHLATLWRVKPSDPSCAHESESGAEGPIDSLGRFPRFWRCDGCGRIRRDADPS